MEGAINNSVMTLGTASGIFSIRPSTRDYGLFFGAIYTNGDAWMQVGRSDGTATAYNLLLQPSGGNVGIGTSSPDAKLDVYDSSTSSIVVAKFGAALYGTTNNTYIEIGTQYSDGSSRIGSSNSSGNLSELFFETATATSGVFAERMRITSNGSIYNGSTSNTHFGYNALVSVTTADESTAFGANALGSQQTGRNTAVGFHALQDLTSGNYNTAVGGEALENITTGGGNVALGAFAGRAETTGSSQIFIGQQAGQTIDNFYGSGENVIIGHAAAIGSIYNGIQ